MEFRFSQNDTLYTVHLEAHPDGSYTATVDGQQLPVVVQQAGDGQLNLIVDGQRVHAYTAATRSPQTRRELRYVALVDRETCFFNLEKVTGSLRRRSGGAAASGTLTAQMPGQVMLVAVSEGDTVAEGDLILLLEAMKMEIQVVAPLGGIIHRLHVAEGEQVERGQVLVEVGADDE